MSRWASVLRRRVRAGIAHDSADWVGWEAASAGVTIADRYQHFSFTIA
jgi:hypothetical protein